MDWPKWLRRGAPILHVAIDEGEGPVVILVHGIASSSVTFQELVPRLVETHRVIAVDILGFGASPSPVGARYTIGEHANALHATIRSLRLRAPFVLVGHSLGSLIAARYTAEHPKGVAKLVLVSPPVYLEPSAFGVSRDRAAMDLYMKAYLYLRNNKQFTMRAAKGLDRISPIRNLLDVSRRTGTPSPSHCRTPSSRRPRSATWRGCACRSRWSTERSILFSCRAASAFSRRCGT